MGDPEHALDQQGRGGGADADRLVGHDGGSSPSSRPTGPGRLGLRAMLGCRGAKGSMQKRPNGGGESELRRGTTLDVVVVGDFNRHDQLWGRR